MLDQHLSDAAQRLQNYKAMLKEQSFPALLVICGQHKQNAENGYPSVSLRDQAELQNQWKAAREEFMERVKYNEHLGHEATIKETLGQIGEDLIKLARVPH